MREPRSETRRRCFLGARLAFNNRNSTLDCLIRDISDRGARLEVARPDDLPNTFDLEIPRERRRFHAEVVWRRGQSCGLRLTRTAA